MVGLLLVLLVLLVLLCCWVLLMVLTLLCAAGVPLGRGWEAGCDTSRLLLPGAARCLCPPGLRRPPRSCGDDRGGACAG